MNNIVTSIILLQALDDFLNNTAESRCPPETSKARIMGWEKETQMLITAIHQGRIQITPPTSPKKCYGCDEDCTACPKGA